VSLNSVESFNVFFSLKNKNLVLEERERWLKEVEEIVEKDSARTDD